MMTPFSTLVLCALPFADTTRATPRRAPFILRGGAVLAPLLMASPAVAGTSAATLINGVGGASSFFGNVRVPAALLAGASLEQMFAKPDDSRGKWVPGLFSVLTALTAMLEISVVFVSTNSGTALLGGGFDPMAADPISFLIREFECPYVYSRFCFFTGLISFVVALGLRAWTTVPGKLGTAILLYGLGTALTMLGYFNLTVKNYRFGILGLGVRCAQLLLAQAFKSFELALGLVVMAASMCLLAQHYLEKPKTD